MIRGKLGVCNCEMSIGDKLPARLQRTFMIRIKFEKQEQGRQPCAVECNCVLDMFSPPRHESRHETRLDRRSLYTTLPLSYAVPPSGSPTYLSNCSSQSSVSVIPYYQLLVSTVSQGLQRINVNHGGPQSRRRRYQH